ncbi:hypothetical protein [Rhizobacter sp. Root1221]|uniref:hypothetical protein n=1 Tax=Rhizobacter sp. Root1221 TaxID=1736433 RepID=UPI0006FF46D5|nr:hypothetical protein [Rhizobacter sp. Root1221]KQV92783.1 hypothetical protein ASC87_27830 [Rhizobacter sp. Root1221]
MPLTTFLKRTARSATQMPSEARALLRWCVLAAAAALIALASIPEPVQAQEVAAALPKVNPLKVGTFVAFDPRTNTVGDAIASVLMPVRYRITDRTVDPLASATVLRRPVSPIVANAGVMSIESAVLLLIGEDHRLVVDHTHRLVAIERHVTDESKEP